MRDAKTPRSVAVRSLVLFSVARGAAGEKVCAMGPPPPRSVLSARAVRALGMTGTATATRQALAAADRSKAKQHLISLAIAENKLMQHDILAPRLAAIERGCLATGTAYAASWLGTPGLRAALAKLYNAHVLRRSRVRSEHVAVVASATSAIETLLFALCEEGDLVVTPAPCYGSYRRDVEARAGCEMLAAPAASPGERPFGGVITTPPLPTADDLEAAVEAKMASSPRGRPRVLLLSNPQNPTGVVLGRRELAAAIAWARTRGMHVIVDEVFALSVFDDAAAAFESALDVVADEHSDAQDVHVVYSCSKDLALSGFRVGCVITRAPSVVEAFAVLGVFCNVGVPVQLAVERLLGDDAWLSETWLPELRTRLRASWESADQHLKQNGLALAVRPEAGHFCLLDLLRVDANDKPLLLKPGSSRVAAPADVDADIVRHLLAEGVILTPGCPNMGLDRPGLFRLCHAGHDAATVADGIRRVARAVAAYRAEIQRDTT